MDAKIVADLNDIVAELQAEPEHGSTADDPARFNTTRWSAVLVAAQSQLPGSQAALTELCRLYWYPLYAFARRRGYGPPDAQDLTQGFFLHLLERRGSEARPTAQRQVSIFPARFIPEFHPGRSDPRTLSQTGWQS